MLVSNCRASWRLKQITSHIHNLNVYMYLFTAFSLCAVLPLKVCTFFVVDICTFVIFTTVVLNQIIKPRNNNKQLLYLIGGIN